MTRRNARILIPVAAVLVIVIFFVVDLVSLFAGPAVRHGLRQRRQHDFHHGMGTAGPGVCPQMRAAVQAPDELYQAKNPLELNSENIFAGESLYLTDAQPTACKVCHGPTGNGMGMMSQGLNTAPRNFSCAETMKTISDGQLFWIIKNGSPGTGMLAYQKTLKDEQIWQLVLYIRRLAK